MILQAVHPSAAWLKWSVLLHCPDCGHTWEAYEERDWSCGVDEYVTARGDDASKCPVCGCPWPEEVAE